MTTVLLPPLNLLATIGDPEGTRTVTSIIALLVAVGLALAMVSVWLYRTTRPDHELLAPLEVMGDRKWRRADPVAQRRTLDTVRPDGAKPLEPSVAPPSLDEAFEAGPTAAGFEDLHGDHAEELDGVPASPGPAPVFGSFPMSAEETPREIDRPEGDDFSDEIDPDVLAAATAELDAELHHRRDDE